MGAPLTNPDLLCRRHRLIAPQLLLKLLEERNAKVDEAIYAWLLQGARDALREAASSFQPGQRGFRRHADPLIRHRLVQLMDQIDARCQPPDPGAQPDDPGPGDDDGPGYPLTEFQELHRLPVESIQLQRAAHGYHLNAAQYQAITRLPWPHRMLVMERVLLERSVEEIARRQHLPAAAVERALQQAYRRMQVVIHAHCGAVEKDCFFGFPVH